MFGKTLVESQWPLSHNSHVKNNYRLTGIDFYDSQLFLNAFKLTYNDGTESPVLGN